MSSFMSIPTATSVRGDLTVTAGAGGYDFNTLPGLVAWYDASFASSITASGGNVSQWNNRKSGGVNMVQGTGGIQPVTGTHTQNGKNVLRFTSDRLDATASATAQPFTLLMVAQFDSNAGTQELMTGGCSFYMTTVKQSMYAGTAGNQNSITSLTGATPYIFSWVMNGANSRMEQNATGLTPIVNVGTNGWGPNPVIGQSSGSVFTGWIAEVLVYTSLSDANRITARNELNTKWACY